MSRRPTIIIIFFSFFDICNSKILDNGGLVKVNAIVSPVDIKSSQFKAMTSNSIRSVVKSVLDGNSLDRNSPCFAVESISNQKPCPGTNEIKFQKSQIRASSFLETYTENYDDGHVFKKVFLVHILVRRPQYTKLLEDFELRRSGIASWRTLIN